MRPDLPNIIIGVAGIVGTLTMGVLGLYFTAHARTSASRQVLYTKQIELAQRTFRAVGRAKNYATLLAPDCDFRDQARSDIGKMMKSIFIMSNEAGLLFPTDLYVAFKEVSNALSAVIQECDEGRDVTDAVDKLVTVDVRYALMLRLLLGVDELSIQSLSLHANEKEMSKLRHFPSDEFVKRAKQKP